MPCSGKQSLAEERGKGRWAWYSSAHRASVMPRRRTVLLTAISSSILALLYSLGLIADWPAWLRGVEWLWVRREPAYFHTQAWLLGGATSVWLVLLMWVVRARGVWRKWQAYLLVGVVMLLAFAAPLTIAAQHRSQPLSIAFLTTVSPTAGFYAEGVRIDDPLSFVREHTSRMRGYRGVHLQTQPPGWPVGFWVAKEVWEYFPQFADWAGYRLGRYDCTSYDSRGLTPAQISAATLQMSILFLGSLGALPLYLLARDEFTPYVARLTLVLYPLLPGFLVFQARFDVLYAVVALTALWLARRAYYHCRWRDALLLAALLAGATGFAFGPLVFIGLVNAFLLAHVWMWHRSWHGLWRLIRIDAVILLTLGVMWAIPWLLWQVSWPQMFLRGREIHQEVRISQPLWALFNVYDLGVFMGLPLLVWAAVGGIEAASRIRTPQQGDAFILGWLGFLFFLNLSGEVRAEAGRLWLFLMVPGSLIGVASLTSELHQPKARDQGPRFVDVRSQAFSRFHTSITALVLVAFAIQAIVTGLYLANRVSLRGTPQARWRVPHSATPVSYELGDTIALRAYTIREQGTEELEVTLYWQALARTRGDYSVFVHLLREDGEIIAQSDGAPMDGALPIWCWVPGEVVADTHVLAGRQGVNGPYQIGVGIYDWRTGERLPVAPPVPGQAIHLP